MNCFRKERSWSALWESDFIFVWMQNKMYGIIACSLFSALLYWNTLCAGFCYDDTRAVLKNPDLLPSAPLTNLWKDDFWGTPLNHTGSHKSYRPLCVLSFRFNYAIGEFQPFGFHLGNIVLHCLVTGVFTYTACKLVKQPTTACLAGAFFASHPIHTEAVSGIVGRADVGAALFFLFSFLSYAKYCEIRDQHSSHSLWRTPWSLAAGGFAALSMLTKEQGITVLAVNVTFDLFIHHRVKVQQLSKIFIEKQYLNLLEGLLSQCLTGVILIIFRMYIAGFSPPVFAPADNPAADSEVLQTRTLTFLFLPVMNFWLLLCPYGLSFDWSMGAIPLVESIFDRRNLYSLLFYCSLVTLVTWILISKELFVTTSSPDKGRTQTTKTFNGNCSAGELNVYWKRNGNHQHQLDVNKRQNTKDAVNKNDRLSNVWNKTKPQTVMMNQSAINKRTHNHMSNVVQSYIPSQRTSDILTMSLALLVFPFLPASNLFFYVGFVIAERILYIPSMGFCLCLAYGAEHMWKRFSRHQLTRWMLSTMVVLLITLFSLRTVVRNQDWLSEENLYRAGIHINPPKAWGNLANILKMEGKVIEAEMAYRNALKHRSNMADVHYNLGILLQESNRFHEACESYRKAIHYRPRLSMAHLNLGIMLTELGKLDEAELIYRHAATLTDDGLKDPRSQMKGIISSMFNLGRLMQNQGRHQEALEVYQKALEKRPDFYAPQSLYNMLGETYFHLQNIQEAEYWYKKSLESKPDHVPAHLTYSNLLSKTNRVLQAEKMLKKAMELEPQNPNVYRYYGQLLNDHGRHGEAAKYYRQAYDLKPEDFEIAFNLANALRQDGDSESAEEFYWIASELKPDEAHTHMNLGAILHINNKLEAAERSYLRALEIEPDHETTHQNLRKLRSLMNKEKKKTK